MKLPIPRLAATLILAAGIVTHTAGTPAYAATAKQPVAKPASLAQGHGWKLIQNPPKAPAPQPANAQPQRQRPQMPVSGTLTMAASGDTVRLWTAGDMIALDTTAVPARDVIVEFTAVPQNDLARIGAVVRYSSPDNWLYVGCDVTTDNLGYAKWFVETPRGRKEVASDIAKLYKGWARRIRIECEGETVTIRVDGERVALFAIPAFGTGMPEGQSGLRVKDGGDVRVYNISIRPLKDPAPKNLGGRSKPQTIASGALKVELYGGMPVPVRYTYHGVSVAGAPAAPRYLLLNGERTAFTSKSVKATPASITYQINIPDRHITLGVECSVQDNVFTTEVTSVGEFSSLQDDNLRTIALPGAEALVTMPATDPQGALSVSMGDGWDAYFKLPAMKQDTAARTGAVVILNNDKLAVTLDNNSLYESRQFLFRNDSVGRKTYIGSNEFIWRDIAGQTTERPVQKVIFAQDLNGDNQITWQDGAVALARIYPVPYGSDDVRNSNITITMNFASEGQFPFLRQLDNIKKIYYLTDGFGQMLELKGYQSEGHDSGHPDYAGHYNNRAGGLKDLQTLVTEARKYNALIGVHINQSESYPEAHAFNDSIVTRLPGWAWLDRSYLINKEADYIYGSFARRLDALKKDLPGLAFIYLDTYREHRALAYRTAQMFNERGWSMWTEDPGVVARYGTWIHYYPDSKSRIARFVHHTRRDAFAIDSLFPGSGYDRSASIGFMGWQSGRDMNLVVRNFYTKQLPYRYLMHFQPLYADPNEVRFEGGITTRFKDGAGSMSRGDVDLMRGTTVFIPWSPVDEHKIFHYNPEGGETTWTLPGSWRSEEYVTIFSLNSVGREEAGRLPVRDGKVTIAAAKDVPYVLYKGSSEKPDDLLEPDWSYGSPVKDMGFDSRSYDYWQPTGDREGVSYEVTSYGQSVLRLSGAKACGVEQIIKGLTPGKAYNLTAWVQIEGTREAILAVQGTSSAESQKQTTSIAETKIFTYVENTDKRRTRYQRLSLDFTAGPSGQVTVSLSAAAGDESTFVEFDDVRIVELAQLTRKDGYIYWQDFERVPFGWGPFMLTRPSSCTTHLSERHDPYTAGDVINGNWSFKTFSEGRGEIIRTMPSLLSFPRAQGGAMYRIEFEYSTTADGVYRAVVSSPSTGRTLVSKPLNGRGRAVLEFSPDADDYYLSIGKYGDGILVIDDFGVKKFVLTADPTTSKVTENRW